MNMEKCQEKQSIFADAMNFYLAISREVLVVRSYGQSEWLVRGSPILKRGAKRGGVFEWNRLKP